MRLSLASSQLWVSRNPVDFRKSIDGLSAVVVEQFGVNPQSGVYVFYNRAKDKLKILGWHRNGFVLVYKRLEQGHFHVHQCDDDLVRLEPHQLSWLLAGLDWPLVSDWKDLMVDSFY